MRKQPHALIFSLYATALIILPTAATYYYQRLLGTDNACQATQYDKNVLLLSSFCSLILIVTSLLLAIRSRSTTLIITSAVLIPTSLALSFTLLLLNAGCFF